jgi:GNAT superfamily N-acetyltransferase
MNDLSSLLQYRVAEAGDIPVLHALIEQSVRGLQAGDYSPEQMDGALGTDRDESLLDPKTDAAKIRAFFVHPEWARRGIGSRILELCEEAARAEGFTCFEMGATLTGVPLYRRWGYAELERIELPLANGASLPIVRMTKAV